MTLPPPAYITSGPHLSGYQVTLGYSTLAEAQDAHSFLATAGGKADLAGYEGRKAGMNPDNTGEA